MEFSIKDFFSKCDQIRRKLRIWSHLLKKSLMENFIFCAVFGGYFCFILKNCTYKFQNFNQLHEGKASSFWYQTFYVRIFD